MNEHAQLSSVVTVRGIENRIEKCAVTLVRSRPTHSGNVNGDGRPNVEGPKTPNHSHGWCFAWDLRNLWLRTYSNLTEIKVDDLHEESFFGNSENMTITYAGGHGRSEWRRRLFIFQNLHQEQQQQEFASSQGFATDSVSLFCHALPS